MGVVPALEMTSVADNCSHEFKLSNDGRQIVCGISAVAIECVPRGSLSGRMYELLLVQCCIIVGDGLSRGCPAACFASRCFDGKPVVEFKDTGFVSYMGLNGTTTNGTLMVQIRDVDSHEAQLRAEGWP